MTSQLLTSGLSSSSLKLLKKRQNNQIFSENNELYILFLLENMEKKLYCNCQNCLMEELPFLAYKLAHDINKCYPESWDKDKKAGADWTKRFIECYTNKISKVPSDCKIKLSRKLPYMPDEVFTINDGQLLLTQLRNMKEIHCICKVCVIKKIPF